MNGTDTKFGWAGMGLAAVAIVALAATTPGRGPTAGQKADGGPVGITVQGHADVEVKPDTAYVSLGVVTKHQSSRQAVEMNAKNAKRIIDSIRAASIAEKDIQTSNFSVEPWYKYDKNDNSRLVGYIVNNTVRVTVRDIKKTSEVVDAGTTAGASSIPAVSFGIADEESLDDKVLAEAIGNATSKAQAMARKLGVKVGRPLSVEQGTADRYNYNMPGEAAFFGRVRRKSVRAVASTPLTPGQLTVARDVEVVFAIER